ncbi:hypothetical protein BKA83DRAFT_4042354 [Pisolithus microcarpus]|nr:hypothetical protein BKA83DRAFT_4042354 [Pisolithus microcarpus]
MVIQTFYSSKSTARRVQPKARPRIKVILSANARAALKLNQHDKAERFKKDLDDAWQSLDKVTKTLASKHHKSIRRVENDLHLGHMKFRSRHSKISAWNAFCWKKGHTMNRSNEMAGSKGTLLDLVRESRMEYHELSAEDKNRLIEEFSEFREAKAIGVRVTTKSKINDITHTLKAVENELHNLKSRTGVETVLYATRGTTDLPLQGVAFATEGVADFMGSVMGIDTQDLVSKLEGFAVRGIKGAAENHQQRVSNVRAAIRNVINCQLRDVTGDPKAKMQWAQYFRNVVTRYQVVIEGWPETIPFANLSSASSSLAQLEVLLRKWELGATYWKALSDDELNQLQQRRNEGLENGEIEEHSRRTRSDKGKKRTNHSSATASKKKYKSAATVNEDDEESGEPHDNASASLQPAHVQASTEVTNDTNPTEQTSTAVNTRPIPQTITHNSNISPAAHSANIQGTPGPHPDTDDMEGIEQQEFLDNFADTILDFDAALGTPY